jgi:hypothetical protein
VLGPGGLCVIPRGVGHLPVAGEEVQAVLAEPRSTLNTGNVRGERTCETLERTWQDRGRPVPATPPEENPS